MRSCLEAGLGVGLPHGLSNAEPLANIELLIAALDVSQIRELRPRVQSFEQLVLPQKHKDIVEALVKTHSRGDRPVRDAVGDEDNDRREDLVRGKGKGVILLLHGVPGVGKTSTAECVAEYTNRPLFALTCGKEFASAVMIPYADTIR
jgi:signal recognition particle GTPase